jgi:septum formation topological specificity factor MinE
LKVPDSHPAECDDILGEKQTISVAGPARGCSKALSSLLPYLIKEFLAILSKYCPVTRAKWEMELRAKAEKLKN